LNGTRAKKDPRAYSPDAIHSV